MGCCHQHKQLDDFNMDFKLLNLDENDPFNISTKNFQKAFSNWQISIDQKWNNNISKLENFKQKYDLAVKLDSAENESRKEVLSSLLKMKETISLENIKDIQIRKNNLYDDGNDIVERIIKEQNEKAQQKKLKAIKRMENEWKEMEDNLNFAI